MSLIVVTCVSDCKIAPFVCLVIFKCFLSVILTPCFVLHLCCGVLHLFCGVLHLFCGGEKDVVLVGDQRQSRQVEGVQQCSRYRGPW